MLGPGPWVWTKCDGFIFLSFIASAADGTRVERSVRGRNWESCLRGGYSLRRTTDWEIFKVCHGRLTEISGGTSAFCGNQA